ncbi:MAG: NADH-quinone oxidoreductase subunit L [Candidatus Latescibacterota bacterium]|nr:NADH-quinone oxidoreductase subunit L [Candidatus Latescibacterota bacterium]
MLTTVELIVLLPLIGAVINGVFGNKLKKTSGYIATAAVGGSFLLGLKILADVMDGAGLDENVYVWIAAGSFSANVGFLVDPLSAIMLVTVTSVSFLVHVYSFGYMSNDEGFGRFFTYLNLFVFSMLILILANNYLLMFVGWEGVGVCSYLLIGFWFERKSALDAGKKAFIVNRIGDFGFLVGIFTMFGYLGTVQFSEVFAQAPGGLSTGVATVIALLLFLGACGKSAQFPLYVWLPDAMEGPTPVSALIHAATMVTAGVYVVARSNVLFTLAPTAGAVVAGVGVLTALLAASIALVNTDLKRVLAYSTVSQLGYMFIGVGVGAYTAGIFHLFTHAFFKGLMFLAAGSVMHAMQNELDMRKFGGLLKKMKITGYTFILGTIAIAGIPPLSGFWSKDMILAGAYYSHVPGHSVIWVLGVLGAVMTSFYMFRLILMTFFGSPRDAHLYDHAHESPSSMVVPLIVLALGAVFVGAIAGYPLEHGWILHFLDPVLGRAVHDTTQGLPEVTLLAISILAGLAGLGIALWMHKSEKLGADTDPGSYKLLRNRWYLDELYDASIVRPIHKVSVALWNIVDTILIDGAVNASAYAVKGISWVSSRFQTGRTPTYALWMLIGTVVMIYAVASP